MPSLLDITKATSINHKGDQYHSAAIGQWLAIEQSRRPCFTTNFILDETLTLLARRTSYAFAAARAKSLMTSQILRILRPDSDDEQAALLLFEKFAEQKVSFTDCISFAMMRSAGISSVFTFDRHFQSAGFAVEP